MNGYGMSGKYSESHDFGLEVVRILRVAMKPHSLEIFNRLGLTVPEGKGYSAYLFRNKTISKTNP